MEEDSEHNKKKNLLDERLKLLIQNNVFFDKAFGEKIIIINGENHAIHHSNRIAEWDLDNLDDFEKKVLKLEEAKKEIDDEAAKNKPLENRKSEYRKIDHLLFEAIAEKEDGKPEKMKAYLALRAKIKKDIPK